MENKCYVIGVYPPPYGGATVKCELFYNLLDKKGFNPIKVDLLEASRKKRKLFSIIKKCIEAFKSEKTIIYCLDSKRLKVLFLLQSFFKKSLEKTIILVVGGVFHETVTNNIFFEENIKKVRGIWVETEGMKKN